MPTALHEFTKTKPFLLCVDSDGCAMDTMNIKHFRCFGPCFADEWGLKEGRDAALKRWNEINLFSMTRGINRFLGLARILTELFPNDQDVAAFAPWANNSKELSERAVEAHAAGNPVFSKALAWSRAVNKAIGELTDERAANENGVFFYPILVRSEEASWEALPAFLELVKEGNAEGEEARLKAAFLRNLGGN